MEINLTLNFNETSLDTLKYFLLYFDKIKIYIPNRIYNFETNSFVNIASDMNIFHQLNYLYKENLISFQDKIDNTDEEFHNMSLKILSLIANYCYGDLLSLLTTPEKIESQILKHQNEIFNAINSGNYQIPDNELISFYLNCITDSDIKCSNIKKLYFKNYYFSMFDLFITTLFNLYRNNNIATNCFFLDNFIYHYYHGVVNQNPKIFINNFIANECLKILLPNFSSLNIDDILELKNKTNDELLELQSYIKDFSVSSLKYDINTSDFNALSQEIQFKLNQSVNSFKRKCQSMKYDIAQKIINDIKNPLAYSPLLLSLFQDIPTHIELLASLSLISSNALLEYFKKSNKLKNNPLYFTYRLSKYI